MTSVGTAADASTECSSWFAGTLETRSTICVDGASCPPEGTGMVTCKLAAPSGIGSLLSASRPSKDRFSVAWLGNGLVGFEVDTVCVLPLDRCRPKNAKYTD